MTGLIDFTELTHFTDFTSDKVYCLEFFSEGKTDLTDLIDITDFTRKQVVVPFATLIQV